MAGKKKGGSKIGPVAKGKLHSKMGVASGKKISDSQLAAEKAKAKRTGNTKLMREVVFAQNARKWNHKGGRKK